MNVLNECYKIIDKILKKGEIKRKDLMIALAIRLNLPINDCNIEKFDKDTLEKALEMLKIML